MTSLVDRSEYAALAEHIYLNQASLGLIPSRSTAAMLQFLSDVAQVHGNIRLSDEEREHASSTSCEPGGFVHRYRVIAGRHNWWR